MCSHCGWLLLKCSAVGIGFNGAETNCGIAHILDILLVNSCNTDIYIFSNYYNLQSVHFEYTYTYDCVTGRSRNKLALFRFHTHPSVVGKMKTRV